MTEPTPPVSTFAVVLQPSGLRFAAGGDQPIAKAARAAGIKLRVSCQSGTCRACICRIVRGTVRYGIAWPGLSKEERHDGQVLPCVAHPTSDLELAEVHVSG